MNLSLTLFYNSSMISYQHLDELKQLYILKATGTQYVDAINIHPTDVDENVILPQDLDALHQLISGCFLCDLSKSRRNIQVFHGNSQSGLMIVNDFPTLAEDNEGAYAGKSGQMLLNMVEKVLGLKSDLVYLTHAVKCMPASGKAPTDSECKSCQPFWKQQIDSVRPKIVLALGSLSYELLTHGVGNFDEDKGKVLPFGDTQLIAIEHPKVLVRNPKLKSDTMQQLLLLKSYL